MLTPQEMLANQGFVVQAFMSAAADDAQLFYEKRISKVWLPTNWKTCIMYITR